jgi:two-component system response regulator FlrC
MIGVSEKVAVANPALAGFLSGAGLASAIFAAADGWHKGLAVFAPDEEACAAPYDLILAFGAETPSFTRATMTAPARLSFGTADLAFGNALAAELLRPAGRPACGEAESAATLDFAARIAASDASVLLLGETGTGKEGLARYIHLRSPRHKGPFTAVNCAALPETMLEAILFGHRKGAFTGAGADGEGLFRAADGGTLLLDEIAEIPLALQAKLLRALQEREILPVGAVRPEPVDLRVIASANRDLAAEVAAGRFRADLYWRLNVMPVTLKPLRERTDDIPAIAAAMLLRHCPPATPFALPTPEALDRLTSHAWPGNCRELENVLQRAILLRAGERIEAGDLVIDGIHARATAAAEAPAIVPLDEAARAAEANVIRAALDEVGGHRVRAAQRLGISERTLRYRLAEMRAVAA